MHIGCFFCTGTLGALGLVEEDQAHPKPEYIYMYIYRVNICRVYLYRVYIYRVKICRVHLYRIYLSIYIYFLYIYRVYICRVYLYRVYICRVYVSRGLPEPSELSDSSKRTRSTQNPTQYIDRYRVYIGYIYIGYISRVYIYRVFMYMYIYLGCWIYIYANLSRVLGVYIYVYISGVLGYIYARCWVYRNPRSSRTRRRGPGPASRQAAAGPVLGCGV